MSTPRTAELRPTDGAGVVARRGELVLLCSEGPQDVVEKLLATHAEVADTGGDAETLAGKLAGVLGDGVDVSLVVFGPAATASPSVLVTVYGHAWANVATEYSEQNLHMRQRANGVRSVVPGRVQTVRAGLGDTDLTAVPQLWVNVDAGVVRGGGLVYNAIAAPENVTTGTPVGTVTGTASEAPAAVDPAIPVEPAPPAAPPAPLLETPPAVPEPVAAAPVAPEAAAAPEAPVAPVAPVAPEAPVAPPRPSPAPAAPVDPVVPVAAEPVPPPTPEPPAPVPVPEPPAPVPVPEPPAPAPEPPAPEPPAPAPVPEPPAPPTPAPPVIAPPPAPASPPAPEAPLPPPLQPVDRSQDYSSFVLVDARRTGSAQPAAPLGIAAAAPEPVAAEPRAPLPVVTAPPEAAAPDVAPPDHPADEGRVQVLGVYCKNGHFDDPAARYCAICGISMQQLTLLPRPGPRPPLGVLVLDDGSIFSLDTDYVMGRDPAQDPDVASGEARPLRFDDPEGVLSRRHARIVLDGWQVGVVDLGSANGTGVLAPGETAWQTLPAQQFTALKPGSQVGLGRRTLRYESHRNT